jgi:phosphoserine phosphatase
MLKKQKVIVFDFDGTLSASDSNREFFRYCFRHSLRPWLFLPVIGFGLIWRIFDSSPTHWRQILRCFITRGMVEKLAPGFIAEHKKRRFEWAKARVASEHYSTDVKVILISAGPDYLIRKLVDDMKFDAVITTKTDPDYPWKLNWFCYAENKVAALDEWAKKKKVLPVLIRAYGDSLADRFIMEIANQAIWIDPKTGKVLDK